MYFEYLFLFYSLRFQLIIKTQSKA